LLIGIFWTRVGTPTGKAAGGTIEEINEHVGAGKPAMIYFSNAPVSRSNIDPEQDQAVQKFKASLQSQGLYDAYEDAADFRNKLTIHLMHKVNDHYREWGGVEQQSDESPGNNVTEIDGLKPRSVAQSLSPKARTLLLEAARGDGGIIHVFTMGGLVTQANKKNLSSGASRREQVEWKEAIQQLERLGLSAAQGSHGDLSELTGEGYRVADEITAAGGRV